MITLLEDQGEKAFLQFRDPKSKFLVKDSCIFVVDSQGVDRLNPAFPSLEGRNLLETTDVEGKKPIREMLQLAEAQGRGWVDYQWPRPGQSDSTLKSAYIRKVKLGQGWGIVGCGVYLPGAHQKKIQDPRRLSAAQLSQLVRDGTRLIEKTGEKAFQNFR